MTFSHRGVNAVVQVACPAVMFTCTVYPIVGRPMPKVTEPDPELSVVPA